jgi:hypothetical protein
MNLLYRLKKLNSMKSAPELRVFRKKAQSIQQRGIIMPLAAISLLSMLGIAALAIDVGYLFVVRNELQNAADSAALAGAGALVPYTGTPATPNWANAEALANNAISLNRAVNADLVNGQVATGYWDITGNRTELNPEPLDANDRPAVMVTIQRSAGNNGGPVNAFFAQVLGINTFNVPARGVAVRSSPSKFGPGVLFPVAISTCMYQNYWDSDTNSPKTATSTAPLGGDQTLPQIVGQPYKFIMVSDYHAGPCDSGQWTSLNQDENNVPYIRGLITNGNPIPLGIGDNIWIQPGTKATLYDPVDNCSGLNGDKTCEYVVISVVDDIETHANNPIVAFACIHIDLAVKGGSKIKKYIQAEMEAMGNPKCIFPNSSGVSGLDYGVLQPPRLVNYGNNNLLRW